MMTMNEDGRVNLYNIMLTCDTEINFSICLCPSTGDATVSSHVTGCAVAQHCYNGDLRFLWENLKL